MTRDYSVTEPHPSVSKVAYLSGGRGGAGNYKRYESVNLSAGPDASGPASRAALTRPAQRTMAGGRGGAGNMFTRAGSEEPIFQFDEELKRREARAPVYHIGRGGAANFINESKPAVVRSTSTDSSASSASSIMSTRNALSKLARKLSNQ